MRSQSRSRRRFSLVVGLGAILLTGGALSYAQATSRSDEVSARSAALNDNPFVGTFVHNSELAPGMTAPAIVSIHSDGTMTLSSSFMFGMPGFPVRFSPIHTVWKTVGPRSITTTSLFFVFDPDGVLLNYRRNRCLIRFDRDFDSYTGVEFMETLACPAGAFSCPDPTDQTAIWTPDPTIPVTGSPFTGERVKLVPPGPLNP